MILVDSLLYKIDQKLNKLSSNAHQAIPLEDKILALNEAQIKLVKQKLDGTPTTTALGFDSFNKRYEDLQVLVEEYSSHKLPLELKDKNINQWVADVTKLTPKYMFYVDSYILADKGKCINRLIRVNPDLTKHADTLILLDNVHYKPSFEYQETFNTISSDEIAVYTDGTFTPKELYISYIRYPKYINKAGWIGLDGKPTVDQNSDLPDYLEDELVDLTVKDLAGYIENIAAIETSSLRLKESE